MDPPGIRPSPPPPTCITTRFLQNCHGPSMAHYACLRNVCLFACFLLLLLFFLPYKNASKAILNRLIAILSLVCQSKQLKLVFRRFFQPIWHLLWTVFFVLCFMEMSRLCSQLIVTLSESENNHYF